MSLNFHEFTLSLHSFSLQQCYHMCVSGKPSNHTVMHHLRGRLSQPCCAVAHFLVTMMLLLFISGCVWDAYAGIPGNCVPRCKVHCCVMCRFCATDFLASFFLFYVTTWTSNNVRISAVPLDTLNGGWLVPVCLWLISWHACPPQGMKLQETYFLPPLSLRI